MPDRGLMEMKMNDTVFRKAATDTVESTCDELIKAAYKYYEDGNEDYIIHNVAAIYWLLRAKEALRRKLNELPVAAVVVKPSCDSCTHEGDSDYKRTCVDCINFCQWEWNGGEQTIAVSKT